jgi:hypothetical protein
MIQRIQSVYLLLVVVLMSVVLVSPLVSFTELEPYRKLTLTSMGLFTDVISYPTYGIITIGLVCALIALVEIFLYKKRKLQIKLSAINHWLLFLFCITIAVYAYVGMQKYSFSFMRFDYGSMLSVFALILNILAKKKIRQDEKLVRSLDRIR